MLDIVSAPDPTSRCNSTVHDFYLQYHILYYMLYHIVYRKENLTVSGEI